ncbi:IBR domain protein (macronuclear) [Tetrahymena thermophila SB210]|uniref:RBR-type E3 ubiquitin transferase n=1 Tax=Tetrahymena thermophila (strain SB210) TaxID=312017 RepID=Q22LZ5_TETTS|nr:IBR domain protein [Tetrahymena thermophila SB210]EAR86452.3 IBR domain protein [Tetrahymena thermophila SB210]|eukprot:XP_977225.3 IBR domain protein [Tetrahymena thermophila SB210]
MSQEENKYEMILESNSKEHLFNLSQDSEADDEEDYEADIDISENNQKDIVVVHKTYEYIEKYFEDLIKETMKEYSIPFGRALLLLSRNSYDHKKLQISTDEKLTDLIYPKIPQNIKDLANKNECLLCFDSLEEDNRYSLACQHYFCKDCFSQYIQEVFKEGQFCIFKTCPLDGCLERLGMEDFKQFLSEEKYNLYKRFLIKDAFGQSETILSCPQPNCPYVQMSVKDRMIKVNQQNITCLCNHEYCNQCKEIGHYPCCCGDFRKWLSKIESQGASANLNDEWFIMNTKPCPKCKIFIEKNQGCMHMTCKQCQHHFCWICLGDWKGHNDYYNCSKFDQEKLNELQREKIELSHFKFHQGQYSHHLSNIQVMKKEIDEIMNYLNDVNRRLLLSNQKTLELDIVNKFCQQILRGRKYLPFFYAKGYFISDKQKLKFFNDLIEDYVRIIEDFNSSLSNLKDIEDKENEIKDKIIIKKSFYQFKDSLSRKLGSCSNYIDQKLKQFTEDLDNFEKIKEQNSEKIVPVKSEIIFQNIQQMKQQQQINKEEQLKKKNILSAIEEKIEVEKEEAKQATIQKQEDNNKDLNKKRKVQFSDSLDQEEIDLGNSLKKKLKSNECLEEIPSKKEINSTENNAFQSQSVLIYRCISENAPLTCFDCGENPATNEYGVCDACFDSLNN